MLHRDVKPSNVMLTHDGRVMLVDFGLASTRGSDRITRSGSQVGSLPYMAPEQVRGDASASDQRTDVYALGVVLYELLTLKLLFLGEHAEITRQRILAGQPPPPRRWNASVPWDAETVCLTAIETDAARRYPTMGDLVRDLGNVLELRPIARRASPWFKLRAMVAAASGASAMIALAVLLVTAGPSLLWWQQAHASRISHERDQALTARQDAERAAGARSPCSSSSAACSAARPDSDGRQRVVDVLDRAAIDAHQLAGQPEVEQAVQLHARRDRRARAPDRGGAPPRALGRARDRHQPAPRRPRSRPARARRAAHRPGSPAGRGRADLHARARLRELRGPGDLACC
ncbi:MAG: protein kinase [Planctomycetota bacterium]